MEQNQTSFLQKTINNEQARCVCFHYVFEDPNQHFIDARTLVRCEMEYLVLTEEIAQLFGIKELKIYAKPKSEGSLWDVFMSVIPGWDDIIVNVITGLISKLVIRILNSGYQKLMECLRQNSQKEDSNDFSLLCNIFREYSVNMSVYELQILEAHQDFIFKNSVFRKLVVKGSQTIERTLHAYEERFKCIHKRFNNSIEREKTLIHIDVTISDWSERIKSL